MIPHGGIRMDAAQRRQRILELLKQNAQPVSASTIAAQFQVSRQVIVGDIALLRA
ncbi:MAG TPA: DNA-binding protein, partial [Lachnoclostridium sp.]|nr:DNA-binding protein [Lachnoclostridium sp.]